MAYDSVLFEDFKVIIWPGQTLTFGWVIAMVTAIFGTCYHGYHGDVDLSLSMCRSCRLDP